MFTDWQKPKLKVKQQSLKDNAKYIWWLACGSRLYVSFGCEITGWLLNPTQNTNPLPRGERKHHNHHHQISPGLIQIRLILFHSI